MSASISSVPPSRRNLRSCSTRSSFTCTTGLISPISSRKIVPFSATSMSPFLLRIGAGERAAHVAEELRVEQRLGERAAVDGDEGPILPRRVDVDRPRDELLAGPALAGDEDGAAGRRNGLDQVEQREHRAAAADDVRELVRRLERALEQHVLLLQPLPLELLADAHAQVALELRPFVHVVGRPEPQRLDRRLGGGERRHDDRREIGRDPFRLRAAGRRRSSPASGCR